MNSRTSIQEELKALNSSLPHSATEPVFTVPDGYFDTFAHTVLAKLRAAETDPAADELSELSPLLAAIPRQMPYTVPEGYFAGLAGNVPALAAEEDLPALLSEHPRQMPYDVPAGYFDTLPAAVLARVAPPKVMALRPVRWMRVAVAALVAGLIALGGIAYFNQRSVVDPSLNPDEWVARKLKGVSSDALEDFIRSTTVAVNGAEIARAVPVKKEVRSMLKDVSDQELEHFLDAVPAEDDLFMIN